MNVISESDLFKRTILSMIGEIKNVTILDLDNLPEKFEIEQKGSRIILVGRCPLADYERYGRLAQSLGPTIFVPVHRSKRVMTKSLLKATETKAR